MRCSDNPAIASLLRSERLVGRVAELGSLCRFAVKIYVPDNVG